MRRRHRANDVYVDVMTKYPGVKLARIDVNGDVVLAGTPTDKQRRQLSGNQGYELFEESGHPAILRVTAEPDPKSSPTNSMNKRGNK